MQLMKSSAGLIDPTRDEIDSTINSLKAAKATAINPPYGFQYAQYVRDLDGVIQGYINEAANIGNSLAKAERDYDDLFDKSIRKTKQIKEVRLTERTGLKL